MLAAPVSRLMWNDNELRWTPCETTMVDKIMTKLLVHGGLVIPDPMLPFVLEVVCTKEGYGGFCFKNKITWESCPLWDVPQLQRNELSFLSFLRGY